MTTIINTPAKDDSGGFGFLLGMLVLVGFIFVILYFGVPAFQRMNSGGITVETPEINVAAPQVNVESNPIE